MDLNAQSSKADNGDTQTIIEEKISKSNGETIIKRYSKGKLLGKGGFAKCFEIVNLETNKVLAAKIIQKSSLTKTRSRQKLISEIKIHKSLHHIHIVAFEHVFEDQENVYILLELCTNQTLNDLLKRRKRLTELEVQCYVVQMIGALKFLHEHRVIHRDLKLGNLFLNDKMEIKLGDFGLATKLEFDGEKKKTICGTPNYIAPEVLDGKVGHSYEVDIWSLGVIIYTLLVGKPPFETPDVKTTYKKIRMNSYAFPEHVPLSDAVKNLISKIFNLDPSKRPTLDEIMAHPFINHGGVIPRVLPTSTMTCPPPASYIKQFLPQDNPIKIMVQPQRLVDTLPSGGQQSSSRLPENQRNNLISTAQAPFSKLESTERANNGPGTMALTGQNFRSKDLKTSQGLEGGFGETGPTVVGSMNKAKPTGRNEIIVKKWINYSSKYGIGYLLSNGATGVFFNDSTKIVSDAKGERFDYIDKRPSDRQDVMNSYSITDYPKELQKKVTLLNHFKNFLEKDSKDEKPIEIVEETKMDGPLVYVKKWMKTKHAIMFRLSNKIVQVTFSDKTEIILSSENKMVTYVNKKAERSLHPLSTALESENAEMVKRLKYTKEILTNMLNNGQGHSDKKEHNTAGHHHGEVEMAGVEEI